MLLTNNFAWVAIVKKELRTQRNLSDILQIFSRTLFEKTPFFWFFRNFSG